MTKYTEVTELGRGGFGVVHQVKDASGNLYARKTFVLNQSFTPTALQYEQLRKRFEREAKLQSGVNHKNIVPIIEKFLDDTPPTFIMPLATSSLDKDISADKSLGGNYLTAINDIMAGLEEIHSMRIFHRDLKPANVLRFRDAPTGMDHYAISDFGLIALKHTQVSQLTTVGMRLTSDFYTAPEITQDLQKASQASDIYSLGCILHDFVGTESRVPCGEIRETGPYSAILLLCTRKDPDRRFKSVSAVRDALLQVVAAPMAAPLLAGAQTLLQALASGLPLDQPTWGAVVDFLEDHAHSADANALIRALTRDRIQEAVGLPIHLSRRIAICYADWVRKTSFVFQECDGYASRLMEFVKLADVEVQSECLLALLFMGTSHNRWYVERLFHINVDSKLPPELAKRLAVEFRADQEKIEKAVAHMEWSISVSRSTMHPVLQDALAK